MKKILSILLFPVLALPLVAQEEEGRPGDNPEVLKEAAYGIDKLIAAFYKKQDLPVPPVTDDATFMRRAFLVSIGRIPTAEEALAFMEIEDESKREDLVAYLMNSQGYSSHMTNWAYDLLRVRDRKVGLQGSFEPYRGWIRTAMNENMPWDEFVTRLVASSGSGWDPETASVGYYTIDRGMALDNVANTMRIFLGDRMECAQCHDDPFNDTERKDFYHIAAFTHGQGIVQGDVYGKFYGVANSKFRYDEPKRFAVAKMFRDEIYMMSLAGGGAGRIPLPKDYQYRDGKPGEMIGAKTPFGDSVRSSDRKNSGTSREEFAEWITQKTGRQFPGTIANRLWERIMGKGIFEPVDIYKEPSETVYPELMNYIAKLIRDLDYDLKAYQHVLMLTKTFQFATNPNPSSLAEGDDFHGRKIERLTAEQIWDSLITLSHGNPDNNPPRSVDTKVYWHRKPVLVGQMDMVKLSDEVLAIKSYQGIQKYADEFLKKIEKGGGSFSKNQDMMSMSDDDNKGQYTGNSIIRASDLPSPAPRNHFLYLFGASDREVVENSSLEPNVGQVLSLMNGFVQKRLVGNYGAHIYRSLEGASSDEEKVRRLYLAIINRPPSDEEMQMMLEEINLHGREGIETVVAALVMSSEFLFLQ